MSDTTFQSLRLIVPASGLGNLHFTPLSRTTRNKTPNKNPVPGQVSIICFSSKKKRGERHAWDSPHPEANALPEGGLGKAWRTS